jgi:hypothetical protein
LKVEGSTGGGGGGGSDGGSFDKSSATFELVRGAKQEFQLTLENKLPNTKNTLIPFPKCLEKIPRPM